MKTTLFGLLLGSLLLLSFAGPLVAQADPEASQCPPTFDHMHKVMGGEHDDSDHAMHTHLGSDQDANGDGWLCAKHVVTKDGEYHIHVDNNYPLTEE